jgi:hypothetical protein
MSVGFFAFSCPYDLLILHHPLHTLSTTQPEYCYGQLYCLLAELQLSIYLGFVFERHTYLPLPPLHRPRPCPHPHRLLPHKGPHRLHPPINRRTGR